MPFSKFTGGVVLDRWDNVVHQYKGVGGIRRYISQAFSQCDGSIEPYMVGLYRRIDHSGTMAVTFMDRRVAKCHFQDYDEMVMVVERWWNLKGCSIAEAYQLDDGSWRYEKFWKKDLDFPLKRITRAMRVNRTRR